MSTFRKSGVRLITIKLQCQSSRPRDFHLCRRSGGKTYRRKEQPEDEKAQQRAENERWGREMIKLPVEAKPPLGKEIESRGLHRSRPGSTLCLCV